MKEWGAIPLLFEFFQIIISLFFRSFIEPDKNKMSQKTQLLNEWRENIFFLSLIATASVFPYSEALVSILAGFTFFQAFALFSWKHPTVKSQLWYVVLFPISIFGIYLIGTVFTADISFALYELRKVVFWIVFPVAIYLSPRLSEKKIYSVFIVFILSVTIASLIITGKLIIPDEMRIDEFRSVSIISHIRFSFQVVLSLIFLTWLLLNKDKLQINIPGIIFGGFIVWLLFFMVLLKSLVGIFTLYGTLLVALLIFTVAAQNIKKRITLILLLSSIIIIPILLIGKVVVEFYDFEKIDPLKVENVTPSGNYYHHDFDQKLRENGHLVYMYICEKELREEWNKRSDIKYDDNLNDFTLGSTLIRYMTSLGYRKDSAGVSKLTHDDIRLIQEGVTNYKFKNHRFSLYPRIYDTVWDLDYYFRTGDPNGKTLSQRIEYARASLVLIGENLWFGIGTGNWKIKYDEVYDQTESRLSIEKRGSSHNQYLNYMVKFGVAGFGWIVFAVLFPVFRLGHRRNFIFVLFLISYAFANLGDANMETHMGLSFFSFFYSLFLWNSTAEMKRKQ